MKKMMFVMAVFLLLFSVGASSEEFRVIEVSKNEILCQILNSGLDCQVIDNQLSVTIRSDVECMEADLDLECGGESMETYAHACKREENLYFCYFDVEPVITVEKPSECEMTFHFYTKLSNESLGEEKYGGGLKITPVIETGLLSLEKQKAKLRNDFLTVKDFDRESIYNSGICSYLGTGILFGEINEYEKEFVDLGGTAMPSETIAGKSLNLLKTSSVLASLYAENGDPLLSQLLDHFLFQGLLTGHFMSDIIYQLSEGYLWGEIFENLESDVDGSCEKIQGNFDHILNPNFLVMEKVRLIDCLEKRDFKNCWKRLGGMENYVNPGNYPERSELRFYLGGYLLRDRSNVCRGSEVKVAYKNLERFGVDHINITGSGGCENLIYMEGEGSKTYSVPEFLCGEGEPIDGGGYSIEVDPGAFGEKVIYRINYYEDPENCKVQQEVIHV